jgi:hypothetical protein
LSGRVHTVLLILGLCIVLVALALWITHARGFTAAPAATMRPGGPTTSFYLTPESVKSQVEINTLHLVIMEDKLDKFETRMSSIERHAHEIVKDSQDQHARVMYLLIANLAGLVVTLGWKLWDRRGPQ